MSRYWMIAVAIFGLDQGSKLVVQRLMEPGRSVEVLGEFLRLTYILNPGGAFGVLGDRQGLLLGVSLLAVAVIVFTVFRSVRTGYVWPVGLLLGGALGNLADRIRYGKVVDFIDLGFWPVFNLADVAIVAGAALLALTMLRRGGHDRGERVDHA